MKLWADALSVDALMWSLGPEIEVLDFLPKRYHGRFFPARRFISRY